MIRKWWIEAICGVLLLGLALGGTVWAGGRQSERLNSHVEDRASHMTPAIHRELGHIHGKLDILLERTAP